MQDVLITCHDRQVKCSQLPSPTIITDLNKKKKRTAAANWRRAKTKHDLYEFCLTYFMANPDGTPRYMRRVAAVKDNRGKLHKVWKICPPAKFHKLSCRHALDENTLDVWARNYAKTTYKLKWAPMWEHICDPTGLGPFEEIHIVSPKNIKSAIEFIKYELLNNELLQYDWGTLDIFNKSSRCNLTDTPEIVFENGGRITSVSTKDQMRGMGVYYRPLVLRCDDLLTTRDARSPKMRAQTYDLIFKDAWLMIDPEGRRHISGTTMDPEDLISKGLKSKGLFSIKIKAAAEFKDDYGRRVSNWPERWPLWRLDRERQRMEREWPGSYSQEMMLIPMRGVNAIYPPSMMRYYKNHPPIQDMLLTTYADLAYGKKKKNSETAISTWGGALKTIEDVCERGDLFCLKVSAGHFPEDEAVRIFFEDHYRHFGMRGLYGAEARAWADILKNRVERKCRSEGLAIPHFDLASDEGLDKRSRAQRNKYFWSEGRAYLHEDDYETREQFLNFAGDDSDDQNDRVDSSNYCLDKYREREKGGGNWYGGQEEEVYEREPVYKWSETEGLHRPGVVPLDQDLIPIQEYYRMRMRRARLAG